MYHMTPEFLQNTENKNNIWKYTEKYNKIIIYDLNFINNSKND